MESDRADAGGGRSFALKVTISILLTASACSLDTTSSVTPGLEVSKSALEFEGTGVGGQRKQVIELLNRSRAPVRVQLETGAPFQVQSSAYLPGASVVRVEIVFRPEEIGPVASALVATPDTGQQPILVAVSGFANDASICPASADGCQDVVFLADEGRCEFRPSPEVKASADECIEAGVCNAGQCTGALRGCDDGLQCTIDSCVRGSGCIHIPSEEACSNLCLRPECDQNGCRDVPRADGEACGPGTCAWDSICINAECRRIPRPDPLGTGHCDSVCKQGCSIRDFELGDTFACLVNQDGSVWCKGRTVDASTGHIFSNHDQANKGRQWAKEFVRVQGLPPVLELDVDTMLSESACAITEAGEVYCWGCNDFPDPGALGTQDLSSRFSPPRKVPGLRQATSISANYATYCATLADGSAWCWGRNNRGQTGAGYRNEVVSWPVRVPLPVPARQVASGLDASCALDRIGNVWCWGGYNNMVDYPYPPTDSELIPARVPFLADLDAIWFAPPNQYIFNGRMRDGRGVQVLARRVTEFPPSRGFFADIDAGCRILADGRVECSGCNDGGQLGNGKVESSLYRQNHFWSATPVNILPGIAGAQWLEASYGDRCVGLADKTIWCWGWNNAYVPGEGWLPPIDISPATTPRQLPY